MGKHGKKPGVCRVKGCRFYGKKMANWESHVLETHKLKMSLHDGLPLCSKKTMTDAHVDSKYRKPRPCLYPGCKKKNSMYVRLNRHLPQHGLSEKRYQLILNMMKVQAKFIKKTNGEIKTSFYDFCPAIQDTYPGHEIYKGLPKGYEKGIKSVIESSTKATLPKVVMNDDDVETIDIPVVTRQVSPELDPDAKFPDVYLFSETVLSKEVTIYNSKRKQILKPKNKEFQVTLRLIRILLSEEHKKCFAWSLFWPSGDGGQLKLQRVAFSDEDEDKAFESFTHALNPDGHAHIVQINYQCYLCHQWHLLDQYATPSVDERPSEWDQLKS